MIQRWASQASLKVSLVEAVSTLAFISSVRPEKPHFMGNTAFSPDRLEAMTGTTFVGRISPYVVISVICCHFSTRGDWFISSTISRNSGEASAQYRQHMVIILHTAIIQHIAQSFC